MRKLIDSLLDILFPVTCVGCGRAFRPSTWLCSDCFSRIHRLHLVRFLPSPTISTLIISGDYADPRLERPIGMCKYQSIAALADPCARLICETLRQPEIQALLPPNPSDIIVVPVPLHRRRLQQRGFNQAELIGSAVATANSWNFEPHMLERIRSTKPQQSLTRSERLTNLTDAFRLKNPHKTAGMTILLVDDVTTTGATFEACAQALTQDTPKRIIGVAAAGQANHF